MVLIDLVLYAVRGVSKRDGRQVIDSVDGGVGVSLVKFPILMTLLPAHLSPILLLSVGVLGALCQLNVMVSWLTYSTWRPTDIQLQ